MTYKCDIQEQHAMPTLALRTRTSLEKLPDAIGQGFGAVIGYLGKIGKQPAGAPYVAYHNMDFADLDVEIGFPVAKKLPGEGAIKASQIPGGKMGTCFYTGPYPEMSVAYEALKKMLAEKGLEGTGICYEIYYNSPMDTEPSKLQTLILFPLKG